VRIDYEATEEALTLTVTDDGCGFDPARAPGVEDGHLGLTVMRERARSYGGECSVTSAPGSGTRVGLWIPLDVEATGRSRRPTSSCVWA
jgi:signal transduction histidine kinase